MTNQSLNNRYSYISPDWDPPFGAFWEGLRTPSAFSNRTARMSLQNIAYLLGALTAGGGTIGYVRTGSVPSIAAGVTVGLLYGIGGYRIQTRQPYGVELALLASIILGGSSIPRAIRLGKPVPTVLSLISVFGLLTFGNAFRKTL
ncbi:transmembrane proteins 14C-domain-containing protein [Nemania sp. NC0429]|nr:transmembrane proteins 14C-domain-containing protein [Nemania sp. NC0429]